MSEVRMTTISIMAFIDSRAAVAHFELPRLDWIPLSAGDYVAANALPRRILEVQIGNEKGVFRHIIPTDHGDEPSWWDALKSRISRR